MFSEYGNKGLKPEQSMSTEIGLQYTDAKDLFQLRATSFNRTVRDMIFFYYNPQTWTSQYINQDRQKDHGLEVEGKWNVSKAIHVAAFYNYVDGKIYTKAVKDTSYHNLLRRPKHSIGASVRAQVLSNMFLSVQGRYVGERKDSYYDITMYRVNEITLKPYTLLDVYGEYTFGKNMSMYADLRNIANTSYVEISGFTTLKRSIYVGMRLKF
jgi:vitamin B12 transporter